MGDSGTHSVTDSYDLNSYGSYIDSDEENHEVGRWIFDMRWAVLFWGGVCILHSFFFLSGMGLRDNRTGTENGMASV